ncbi:MAG: triphosphoribosyl-dephospho-CoA synthase [Candidatus Bathyarchaeota archaeon]|nr:triphosphoribosyl-dephospho-CoA synthase [Candidatus Bathyarchaeota archaeon]MDH5787061.1 triphosphoribosyl-dephospho-CoA synthase [Candidatus Bathyarchaeota archaeon]
MQKRSNEKAKHISQCLELAILFEVSADKPGNVNLVVGFEGTRHEHFLASAVAAASYFESAAKQGMAFSRGEIHISNVGLGQIIKECATDVNAWQHGGNTLLGTIILLSPIAVAAGMTSAKEEHIFEISELRRNLRHVVESTTAEDAVKIYEAIKIATPSGLGKAPELDVNDPDSMNRIVKENVSLYQVFKIASSYDGVCSEWVNNYPITFDFAYPYLMEQIKSDKDLNAAIIHTFLKVLAEYPDTFIARKVGSGKAQEVSSMAEEVLRLGGLKTLIGKERMHDFDLTLRESGSLLNPGTTADIIAAALALGILSGYRP